MKISKKLKIIFLSFLAVFLVSGTALAYFDPGDGAGGGIEKWEDAVYGEKDTFNLQSNIHATARYYLTSTVEFIRGPQKGEYKTVAGEGALPIASSLIASLYQNRPASFGQYLADVKQNLGLTKPVYAQQGTGFSALSKLLPLWKTFRDTAYLFFTLAFIVIGLMIMFRVKISPQAIVTIQAAIPKIIISLILVTFSYAIVGLLIDFMYLLIYLGVLIVHSSGQLGGTLSGKQAEYSSLSFFDVGSLAADVGDQAKKQLYNAMFKNIFTAVPAAIMFLMSVATGGNDLFDAIIGIIILFMVFKLFFALISSYLSIILSVIFGPIQIMIGALPNSKGGFGSWFRNLLANVLAFPAVAIVLLIASILTSSSGPDWTPPVLGINGAATSSIIGLGILMLLPKIPTMIKSAFQMKEPGYGTAIGAAFGPIKTGLRVGAGPAAAKVLPSRVGTGQWYWKIMDFGKGQKWWS